MPLRYGFELEYNGNGAMTFPQGDPDIQRSYDDGTYTGCYEVCSQPKDGLRDLFLTHHRVVARLLNSGRLEGLYTRNQARTGLHISINDPTYTWDQYYYNNPPFDRWPSPLLSWRFITDGRVDPLTIPNTPMWYHRHPQYPTTRIKRNRVESARGLSTLNPYCFLQYVFVLAKRYNEYREFDNQLGSLGFTLPRNWNEHYMAFPVGRENHIYAPAIRDTIARITQLYQTYLPIANNAKALLTELKESTNDPCDVREILSICRDTEALSVRPANRGTFNPNVCELGYHKQYGHRRARLEQQEARRASATAST